MNRHKNGFTLAELMAVVAILAILAGLALGSYRKAMDRAQIAEGIQGAHTLVAALEDYYYEQIPNAYPYYNGRVDMSKLNTGLSKATVYRDRIETPHFIYTVRPASTEDLRPIGIKAEPKSKKYYLTTYLNTIDKIEPDRCYYFGAPGKDACQSGGYGTCHEDEEEGYKVCL